MYQETSSKLIYVGPHQAEEFLKLNTFPAQRALNQRHVQKLENEMNEGTFNIGSIATAAERYADFVKVMVNGQHQCHAVINTGKQIKVVYQVYDVFSPRDLSLLFRKFDNNFVRTLAQKSLVEARALDMDWPPKIVSLITSGIRYKTEPGSGKKAAGDVAIEELQNHLKVGEFIRRLFVGADKKPRHLMRGPVVHAIMLTWEKSQGDTLTFWTQVRDGEGLKKADPSMILRDFLMTTSVGYGQGLKDVKLVSMHEMVSKCVTAWNAFRKGARTDLKYYSSKPIPRPL